MAPLYVKTWRGSLPRVRAAQGYGATLAASRVATAIAARQAHGLPWTPEGIVNLLGLFGVMSMV